MAVKDTWGLFDTFRYASVITGGYQFCEVKLNESVDGKEEFNTVHIIGDEVRLWETYESYVEDAAPSYKVFLNSKYKSVFKYPDKSWYGVFHYEKGGDMRAVHYPWFFNCTYQDVCYGAILVEFAEVGNIRLRCYNKMTEYPIKTVILNGSFRTE